MSITVSFLFQVKNCNGSMNIDIVEDNKILFSGRDLDEGLLAVDLKVSRWPTELLIYLTGKRKNDTLCDDQGIIITDKSIEVVGITLNRFPLHIDLLDRVFDCEREGSTDISHENYWGFNGKVTMKLHGKNPVRYLLSHNNQFDINKLSWNDHE